MLRNALLIAILFLNGCDNAATNKEISNKSEYSVLQYYEYELRNRGHENSYMVFKDALNTKLTVLAFPIKNKSEGYVVMLANKEDSSEVKAITQAEFVVTKEAYAAVKKEVILSAEIDRFIAGHIR